MNPELNIIMAHICSLGIEDKGHFDGNEVLGFFLDVLILLNVCVEKEMHIICHDVYKRYSFINICVQITWKLVFLTQQEGPERTVWP